MVQGWVMFDCGCVTTRPRDSKYFASRWRIYMSMNMIMLKCKDCGRVHHFELKKPYSVITSYSCREAVESGEIIQESEKNNN